MKKIIKSDEDITLLREYIKSLSVDKPLVYLYFELMLNYGIRSDELLALTPTDLYRTPFSSKYPSVVVDKKYRRITSRIKTETLFEGLPSRNYLHHLLNKCKLFDTSIGITTLLKTWAYMALKSGTGIREVMGHFNYQHAPYKFLTEYLGLTPEECFENRMLSIALIKSRLKDVMTADFTKLSDSALEIINDQLFLIESRVFK